MKSSWKKHIRSLQLWVAELCRWRKQEKQGGVRWSSKPGSELGVRQQGLRFLLGDTETLGWPIAGRNSVLLRCNLWCNVTTLPSIPSSARFLFELFETESYYTVWGSWAQALLPSEILGWFESITGVQCSPLPGLISGGSCVRTFWCFAGQIMVQNHCLAYQMLPHGSET